MQKLIQFSAIRGFMPLFYRLVSDAKTAYSVLRFSIYNIFQHSILSESTGSSGLSIRFCQAIPAAISRFDICGKEFVQKNTPVFLSC